jgi:hypothetical protein
MLYREIIAVCFEIYTEHIHTLCGQNVECLHVKKLVVHKVTPGLWAETAKEAPGKGWGVFAVRRPALEFPVHVDFEFLFPDPPSCNTVTRLTELYYFSKGNMVLKAVNLTYTNIRHRTKTEKVNVILETYLRHWVWVLPSSSV